jgi:hypothetical protein
MLIIIWKRICGLSKRARRRVYRECYDKREHTTHLLTALACFRPLIFDDTRPCLDDGARATCDCARALTDPRCYRLRAGARSCNRRPPLGYVGYDATLRGFKTRHDVRRLMSNVPRRVARPQDSWLGRQSGFCETLGYPTDVLFILERLSAEMFSKGVFWIDLFKFLPDSTSLVDVTKMTKSGSH